MTPSEIVTSFIAAIEAKDLDRAAEHVSADVYYENIPIGGMTGPDDMKKFLAPLLSGDDPVEFEVLRQVGDDTTVMNDRIDRMTVRGRRIELPVAGVFEVADGKITLWRDFFDEATFNRQLAGED